MRKYERTGDQNLYKIAHAGEAIAPNAIMSSLMGGARWLMRGRRTLNDANAFPVRDRDTGNNMAHTVRGLAHRRDAFENCSDEAFRTHVDQISEDLMINARGNSGAIFSQYIDGFLEAVAARSAVTLHDLVESFQAAYGRAYRAIEKPVEGTMITLMRFWPQALADNLDEGAQPEQVFENSLERLNAVLEETAHMLPEQKRLGKVDAGALGYFMFMKGFIRVLVGEEPLEALISDEADASYSDENDEAVDSLYAFSLLRDQGNAAVHTPVHGVGADGLSEDALGDPMRIERPYCTELLFRHGDLDPEALRSALLPLGDSLVTSFGRRVSRIHIHTDRPVAVVHVVTQVGTLIDQKVDNMAYQMQLTAAISESPEPLAIVVDSIADIPESALRQMHVYRMPLNLMIGDVTYQDKLTVDTQLIEAHRRSGEVSSSQPNLEQVKRFLMPILGRYRRILVITVSGQMSGLYGRYRDVVREMKVSERVTVFDSRTNSGAEGLMVLKAIEQLAEGASLERIVAMLEAYRERAYIWVSLPHLRAMVDSGRLSERIGKWLVRLNFLPLITIDRKGKGTIRGIAFSRKQNEQLLLRQARRVKPLEYAIVHADAPDRAEWLRREMKAITDREPQYIAPISSVVTLFSGKGSIALVYFEPEEV